MGKNAKLGIWLIVFGVPLNNYAYLHDLVTGSHQGYIYIGTNALIGIVVGILVSVRSGRGMGPVKRISHVEARPHKVLSFCW